MKLVFPPGRVGRCCVFPREPLGVYIQLHIIFVHFYDPQQNAEQGPAGSSFGSRLSKAQLCVCAGMIVIIFKLIFDLCVFIAIF